MIDDPVLKNHEPNQVKIETEVAADFLTKQEARDRLVKLRESEIKVEMPEAAPGEGFLRKEMLDALLAYLPRPRSSAKSFPSGSGTSSIWTNSRSTTNASSGFSRKLHKLNRNGEMIMESR